MTAAILVGAACACDVLDPDREDLGYLGGVGTPIEIVAPDTAQKGSSFEVTISVYGSGSCTRVERVDVRVAGNSAKLRPIVRTEGSVCTDDLRRFVAIGRVTFNVSGPAELHVSGRYGVLDNISRLVTRDTVIVREIVVR